MTLGRNYWENKHPKVNQVYNGRVLPILGGQEYSIDVRHFIWAQDIQLANIIDYGNLILDNNDLTAQSIQQWVVKNLTYVGDSEQMRAGEFWLFPAETLKLHKGDCEDGAILMASLLLNALPQEDHWRVRVAAGWVQSAPTAPQGGHAYVTYCRCSDNQWVALDWCYYEDSDIAINKKPMVKEVKFYKDVWFSFNNQFAWSHIDFNASGRLRNL